MNRTSFFCLLSVVVVGTLLVACGGDGDPSPGGGSNTNPTVPSGSGSGSGSGAGSGSGSGAGADGGASSVGPAASGPCAANTKALCEKAATCGAGPEVTISYGSASELHESLAMCISFYGFLACAQPEAAVNYGSDACRAAIAMATCSTTNLGKPALLFPKECGSK